MPIAFSHSRLLFSSTDKTDKVSLIKNLKIRFRNFRILVLTFDLGYLNYSTTNCSSSSIYQYSVSCFWSADFKEPKICCIPVRKNITLYILKVIMSFKKYINILFPCIINKQEERLLLTSNPEDLYTST